MTQIYRVKKPIADMRKMLDVAAAATSYQQLTRKFPLIEGLFTVELFRMGR
jgi:hypothetical protein